MIRKEIRCAVLSFFLISLGGLLLGLRLYPPMKLDPFEIYVNNLLLALPGIISVFVLPFMFIPLRVVNARVEKYNCLFGSNLPRTKR